MVGMSHSEENISESVADCLEVHLERFDQIFAALDAGHRVDSQDAHTTLHDAPLDVTVHRRLTALLADGEPRVEASAGFDETGQLSDPKLVAAWGGGTLECVISPGVSLYRALQAYAEGEVL